MDRRRGSSTTDPPPSRWNGGCIPSPRTGRRTGSRLTTSGRASSPSCARAAPPARSRSARRSAPSSRCGRASRRLPPSATRSSRRRSPRRRRPRSDRRRRPPGSSTTNGCAMRGSGHAATFRSSASSSRSSASEATRAKLVVMDRDTLARTIYERTHLTGEFRLRSGAVSSEYFDKYLFESDPLLLRTVGEALVPLLPPGTDALAGLELGGVPLGTLLSQLTGLSALFVGKEG